MESKKLNLSEYCSFEAIVGNELGSGNSLFSYNFRMLNFGVWIWFGKGSDLFFTESLLRIIGIPAGMVPTLELVIEYIHPDDQDKFLTYLECLLDKEKPEDFSFWVWLPNNTERTIMCQVGKLLTERKDGYDVVGVCWQVDDSLEP